MRPAGQPVASFRSALALAAVAAGIAAFNLARTLAQTGQHQRALPVYDRVLQLTPRDLEARYHRAQTLLALGRNEEAAAELQAIRAQAPGDGSR